MVTSAAVWCRLTTDEHVNMAFMWSPCLKIIRLPIVCKAPMLQSVWCLSCIEKGLVAKKKHSCNLTKMKELCHLSFNLIKGLIKSFLQLNERLICRRGKLFRPRESLIFVLSNTQDVLFGSLSPPCINILAQLQKVSRVILGLYMSFFKGLFSLKEICCLSKIICFIILHLLEAT